jgi:beta-lactamase superfamily II metal-dependent hydrolase
VAEKKWGGSWAERGRQQRHWRDSRPLPSGWQTALAVLCLACLLLSATASSPARPALAMPALRVVTVPILEDNYAYIIVDETSKSAAAVDPADANAVVAAAAREGVTLTHVLTTHCHWDHAGGNKDMVCIFPAPRALSICSHVRRPFSCCLSAAGFLTIKGDR